MQMFSYETPVGELWIVQTGDAISHVLFHAPEGLDATRAETPLIRKTYAELLEYFAGARREFSVPLAPEGTAFQQKVWAALCEIGYGETMAYSEIADMVGSPKAARAVGMANNRNPISIIIPCHRVIGKSGKLVGYGGGLDKKVFLLELEGQGQGKGQEKGQEHGRCPNP